MVPERKFNLKIPATFKNEKSIQEVPDPVRKTMLEIANEVGVDKQKVYRCIKKYGIPYETENDIIYLNETAQTRIKSLILQKTDILKNSNDTVKEIPENQITYFEAIIEQLNTVIALLQKGIDLQEEQIREKNKKIEELLDTISQSTKDSQ